MIQDIIRAVSSIFQGADTHQWDVVQQAMAGNVLLDYSSLSGSPAASLPASQIVDSWKNFLPGFDRTHHQLSDFQVNEQDDKAEVHFNGKADHFIGSDIWTVQGAYDATLVLKDDQWQVTALSFNLQNQSGNTELPAQAMKNMADNK